MNRKKILVVTYYWPPSGGGGVQRWLKFVKYLPEFGWDPVVCTPDNPVFDLKDESLQKDVSSGLEILKLPIWEPLDFYKRLFKKKGEFKQGIVIEKTRMSLMDKCIVWIRGNLFIPDPRRFWVRPAVRFLSSYLEKNEIDAIVTTGPPHSMHFIGRVLKKKTGITWIADFRDPWSDWDMLDKLRVSPVARKIHLQMEKRVLQSANLVLSVNHRLAEALSEKSNGMNVAVITNGVDDEDFQQVCEAPHTHKFRITHIGLLNEIRDPTYLWEVLEELCEEEKEFSQDLEILLAGMVSDSILDRLQRSAVLSTCVVHLDYIPHQEVFGYYKTSSMLLLLLNQTEKSSLVLPGKLFEYLLANTPIMTLGTSESDVRDILKETHSGDVFSFDDKEKMRKMIRKTYQEYKGGHSSLKSQHTEKYLRRNLTRDLADLLNDSTA